MNKSTRPADQNETTSAPFVQTKDRLAVLIAEIYSSGIYYGEAIQAFKKQYLTHVLLTCNGNQSRAAIELGVHRNTLCRTIVELKMRREEWDPKLQLAKRLPAMSSGRERRVA